MSTCHGEEIIRLMTNISRAQKVVSEMRTFITSFWICETFAFLPWKKWTDTLVVLKAWILPWPTSWFNPFQVPVVSFPNSKLQPPGIIGAATEGHFRGWEVEGQCGFPPEPSARASVHDSHKWVIKTNRAMQVHIVPETNPFIVTQILRSANCHFWCTIYSLWKTHGLMFLSVLWICSIAPWVRVGACVQLLFWCWIWIVKDSFQRRKRARKLWKRCHLEQESINYTTMYSGPNGNWLLACMDFLSSSFVILIGTNE